MKIFKNLKLKWKISFTVALVFILVMICVVSVTYRYTSGMVSEQITRQIEILGKSKRDAIESLLSTLEKRVTLLSREHNVLEFVKFNKMYGFETIQGTYTYTVVENARKLRQFLDGVESGELIYVTDSKGNVLVDTRVNKNEDVKKYCGNKLDEGAYLNIRQGEIVEIDKRPLLLLNKAIVDPGSSENEVLGYCVIGVSIDIFASNLDVSLGNMGGAILFNGQGLILNHQDPEQIGNWTEDEWYLSRIQEGVSTDQTNRNGYLTIMERVNESNFYLAYEIPLSTVQGPAMKLRNIIIVVALIGLLVIFVVTYLLISALLKPLGSFVQAFKKLREGSLKERIEINTDDELGHLSRDFNQMTENLRNMARMVNQAAEETLLTSKQLAASSSESAGSVDEVARSTREFAETTEQLSGSSQEMANTAEVVNKLAQKGLDYMDRARKEMRDILTTSEKSLAAFEELQKSAGQIENIVSVISGIAEQTNLLALNAAIEAARAGSQGRGFAVVADEVRALAEETQNSAGNIKELIQNLVQRTEEALHVYNQNNGQIEEGARVLDETGTVFKDIVDRINHLVPQIEEVASAGQQLTAGSEEISAATEEQSAMMQQISASTKELERMAEKLKQLVSRFKI